MTTWEDRVKQPKTTTMSLVSVIGIIPTAHMVPNWVKALQATLRLVPVSSLLLRLLGQVMLLCCLSAQQL